ncbi:hypothetical protein Micbo1qcDRAFT_198464 [Microdochium bolleyi]|uniref:Uncharacterized protein n=1 Tax=Microdochium bolleyi TaxID=196109 RepID=A0A136IMF8_9PEZI|nr:hypothetical protein Micbo1qcDRAFT_198464 [Microdochium bolleyi]
MAQAATVNGLLAHSAQHPASIAPAAATDAPADPDMHTLLEYQKLAQFRDTILAGKHPHIKLPVSTARAAAGQPPATHPRAQAAQQPTQNTGQKKGQSSAARRADKKKTLSTNGAPPAVAVAAASSHSDLRAPGLALPTGQGRAELDPIFLEKSEDLVRAELRIQRQRLEKSLRDELEHRKASAKAAAQEPESLLEFNLSDVLVKALTLVQATSAPFAPDLDVAPDGSESSDSFDNNTFYSSQHDTPDPHDVSTDQPAAQSTAMEGIIEDDPYSPTQNFVLPPAQPSVSGGPKNGLSSFPPGLVPTSAASVTPDHRNPSGDSGANSRAGDSGNAELDQAVNFQRSQSLRHQMSKIDAMRQPSPLVRAHDLSPYAPQPAHVSPLAFGQQPSILEPLGTGHAAAPAPVMALRPHESAATSPESSPHGDKGSKRKDRKERKKEKRKHRARNRAGYTSPDIKPEPQSPSPISASALPRPAKRQRSDHGPHDVVVIEAPAAAQPVSRTYSGQFHIGSLPGERAQHAWERVEDPLARSGRSSAVPSVYRPEQPQLFERRYDEPGHQYVRRVYTPPGQPSHFVVDESRPLRTASYSIPQPEYREVPAYAPTTRPSAHPYGDHVRSRSPIIVERRSPIVAPSMPPPQPARIVVDQYGREYFEPPPRPASTVRQSAIPAARPREHEIVYERAPVRAMSRIPAEGTFEENGIIYRRVSPQYGGRRVVTQPEYGRPEYTRGYRDREYSTTQPAALPRENYVEYRSVPERRVQQEAFPGDYITRSASVRPPQEAVPGYGSSQVPSVRSEVPPRHYAASVRPDARREPALLQQQQSMTQEYDPRSAGQDLPPPPLQQQPPRGYSVRPVEQYYYEPQPPGDAEMAYGQRPQSRAEVVIRYVQEASRKHEVMEEDPADC